MSLESDLHQALGALHVITDPELTASYGTDWTGRWSTPVRVVARPADTAGVVAVVRAARTHGVPVVTQGGNTGLVGGSVPRPGHDAVVLSTTRLDAVGEVDLRSGQVTAGAGATLASVQQQARRAGRTYGVDLAARDSATIGGTVATNAGGVRVCRYGDTRHQVVGVEAVLADGSVVSRLGGLAKDSTGYDLSGLFVGSEGTLGVVTAVRLSTHPATTQGTVTLIGCRDVDEALAHLAANPAPWAAEVMFADGADLVRRVAHLPAPLARDWPVLVLLETADLPTLPGDADAAVDPRLWEYRERHTEALATLAAELGVPHKMDVALPLARLGAFLAELPATTRPHPTYVWGHLAEGNLHVNVLGATPDDPVDQAVLRLAASYGGSIAAEHGVGVAKADLLHLTRSEAEIAAMRAVKRALDPDGLLNPGVVLPQEPEGTARV
ncbi:MAG TPA: FAD-binding oxidoreductase [Jiangellales bacterium]|nr:FAD-binding oxidoreductase [Jiangellales bacterium]